MKEQKTAHNFLFAHFTFGVLHCGMRKSEIHIVLLLACNSQFLCSSAKGGTLKSICIIFFLSYFRISAFDIMECGSMNFHFFPQFLFSSTFHFLHCGSGMRNFDMFLGWLLDLVFRNY